jgi:hypothetical protein
MYYPLEEEVAYLTNLEYFTLSFEEVYTPCDLASRPHCPVP